MTRADWYPHPGLYLAAVRRAFAITAAGGTVRPFWSSPDMDARAWRREFRTALHRRINRKGGLETRQTGRKWRPDYQTQQRRDAYAVRDWYERRVCVTYLGTPELRRRYGHLIQPWDGV